MRCEYAMRAKNPKPLFIRTVKYMGENRQIDIRRIETLSRYHRPPWKPVDEKQYDFRLSAFVLETNSERYSTETARILEEDYIKLVKIYTDESKMGDKVGYAIVKEEHTIKKIILCYLKTRCSVRSSLQLLEQYNRRKSTDKKKR
jgi:hypothetical protein